MSYCVIVYHDGETILSVQSSTNLDVAPCLDCSGVNTVRFEVEGEFETASDLIPHVSIVGTEVKIDGRTARELKNEPML